MKLCVTELECDFVYIHYLRYIAMGGGGHMRWGDSLGNHLLRILAKYVYSLLIMTILCMIHSQVRNLIHNDG